MPEGRSRLFKIRRYIKKDGRDCYEWFAGYKPNGWAIWVDDQIDAEAYVSYIAAVKRCEFFKVHNNNPDVIYHSVVPA